MYDQISQAVFQTCLARSLMASVLFENLIIVRQQIGIKQKACDLTINLESQSGHIAGISFVSNKGEQEN